MKKKYLVVFFFCFIIVIVMSLAFLSRILFPDKNTPILHTSPIPSVTLKPEFIPQKFMVDQIFKDDHRWVATLSSQRIRTLIVTGDIIPARSVNFNTLKRNDFTWVFASTAAFLKKGDITFINLEAPLIKNCLPTTEGMVFCGDQRHIQGLLFSGVDVVSFANNHMGNYDTSGILLTVQLLLDNGILVTGTGSAAIKDVRGKKFAFLGYNEIGGPEKFISWVDQEKIKSDIFQAKQKADIVVVTFHWGVEYTNKPTKQQQDLAHLAIDSGVDLVIGNHPHWVQSVEVYNNKFIAYAHGNFIFDQMWSEKTREGVIGKYTFFDNTLIDAEYFPIVIYDYGQPRFATGNKRLEILQNMKKSSL